MCKTSTLLKKKAARGLPRLWVEAENVRYLTPNWRKNRHCCAAARKHSMFYNKRTLSSIIYSHVWRWRGPKTRGNVERHFSRRRRRRKRRSTGLLPPHQHRPRLQYTPAAASKQTNTWLGQHLALPLAGGQVYYGMWGWCVTWETGRGAPL